MHKPRWYEPHANADLRTIMSAIIPALESGVNYTCQLEVR